MVKKEIIPKAILYFLLVDKASKSSGLALLVLFIVLPVGIELFIVSGCRSLVEMYCAVGVGSDYMEFGLGTVFYDLVCVIFFVE